MFATDLQTWQKEQKKKKLGKWPSLYGGAVLCSSLKTYGLKELVLKQFKLREFVLHVIVWQFICFQVIVLQFVISSFISHF